MLSKVIQHASAAKNLIWPGVVKWPSGVAPTITTTAGAVDLITLYYDGSTYLVSGAKRARHVRRIIHLKTIAQDHFSIRRAGFYDQILGGFSLRDAHQVIMPLLR